jgi:hypothetical protein
MNFEDLVRLFLKHDMLAEACALAVDSVSQVGVVEAVDVDYAR